MEVVYWFTPKGQELIRKMVNDSKETRFSPEEKKYWKIWLKRKAKRK